MSFKAKLKIKFLLLDLLSIVTILIILGIAFINDRVIETIFTMILFFVYRKFWDKQFHAKSLLMCSAISILVFCVIIRLEVSFTISVLFVILLTYLITYISYNVRDHLDNKVILKSYQAKEKKLSAKSLKNLSKEELIEMMPNVDLDIINIVYGYLHKKRYQNSINYAYSCNISESTLFRYVKIVKENYEKSSF